MNTPRYSSSGTENNYWSDAAFYLKEKFPNTKYFPVSYVKTRRKLSSDGAEHAGKTATVTLTAAASQQNISDPPDELWIADCVLEALVPRQNEAILCLTVCLETSFIKKKRF